MPLCKYPDIDSLSPCQFPLTNPTHDWTDWNTLLRLKAWRVGDHITLVRGGISPRIHVAWIILPWHHAHKISNKWRNTALEDCRVATNHILIVHLSLVKLLYNCNTDTCYIRRFVPYLWITVVRSWRIETFPLVGVPRNNTNKVCYKRRHLALENSWITTDSVFLVHICVIELLHHCNQSQQY